MQVPSAQVLPDDYRNALLVGRVFDPVAGGPAVVIARGDELIDVTHIEPTVSMLLERADLSELLVNAESDRTWRLDEVLRATLDQDYDRAHLLAPVDLQVIKAAGVTFVQSMLERVIEERSAGEPARAEAIRTQLDEVIGTAIGNVRPGTPEAAAVKEILIREGLWSQYLEVGIGPDPEIFTKAPVLSAVGTGAAIGVLARSTWNNPEPELALAVTSTGKPVGAMLANDVNLRDFEGRSALLLTEAKDNNASCALGPFIRIFDDSFTLQIARSLDIELRVTGTADKFEMNGTSSMSAISRDLLDLIHHAWGPHHQYPDGFVLLTGTLFAPTQDRGEAGAGFTHHEGDRVSISSPKLGALINTVTSSETAPDWVFGISSLMRNLASRGLLPAREEVTA
ncbi:fumarylacetoacetate hydrolase family protein [Pseudarthrobacter sp. NamE2]|uniref:fumarylacetoacetate hydrolase family protein n=1 Tax=Pseudarthrobacter sp. NamE2 TaxID=2576838 RepID=UPI00197A9A82|nr:fumarylacetoacetate hydrolase family protein [Pseudarthrobacter sp. NamE2]